MANKGAAKQVVRRQQRAVIPGSAQASDAGLRTKRADVAAARLAQIVNLHIAGYSLAQIGDAIGCSADEVDRILTQDTARYIRSQPALRVYVRNFISERYSQLLAAVWDEATDKDHGQKLDNSAQALRILKEMARLHGAEAPVQTEMSIDAAPEAVEKLVSALASAQGLGYDDTIFDVIDADVVDDAVHETHDALVTASSAVGESGPSEDGGEFQDEF